MVSFQSTVSLEGIKRYTLQMGDNAIYFYMATQCVSSIFYREAIHNMSIYINLYICMLCICIHMLWRVNRDAQHTYMYTHTNVCIHTYICMCVCILSPSYKIQKKCIMSGCKNIQSYLPSTIYSFPFSENRCSKIK